MKTATQGSNALKFDIVCLSFDKEQEKGLKVIQGASKNSEFDEKMSIKVENGALRSNNTIQSENGNIIVFKENAFKDLKEKIQERKIGKQENSREEIR